MSTVAGRVHRPFDAPANERAASARDDQRQLSWRVAAAGFSDEDAGADAPTPALLPVDPARRAAGQHAELPGRQFRRPVCAGGRLLRRRRPRTRRPPPRLAPRRLHAPRPRRATSGPAPGSHVRPRRARTGSPRARPPPGAVRRSRSPRSSRGRWFSAGRGRRRGTDGDLRRPELRIDLQRR
jgi:hypothetical protein